MIPDLQRVIELQQVDSEIQTLSSQIDSIPASFKAAETELNDSRRAYDAERERLDANQKERRDLEGEIQLIRSKIGRHKDQLYEVKTNEQYRTMLHEIEGEEQKIRGLEDRILERMLEAEQLENLIRDAAQRLDSQKARAASELARLEALRQADQAERSGLLDRRQKLMAGLAPSIANLYERIRKARRGLAVTAVRDGSCGGCHVRLRPQALNDVRSNDKVATCESCGRILYYVEPAATEASSSEDQALSSAGRSN